MKTPQRVTLKDLAHAAGISVSAVSLALRNHPRISEETKRKVRAVALSHNYLPDPKISQLMSSIRGGANRPLTSVGLVTPIASSYRARYSRLFRGVQDRANELSFAFEEFPIIGGLGNEERLEHVLRSRRMDGVIFFPLIEGSGSLKLSLEGISSVAIGYSLSTPELHRVAFDHSQGIELAIRQLRSLGYSRIGLCVSGRADTSSRHAWLRGWAAHAWETRADKPPEPYTYEKLSKETFAEWFKHERPDVILSDGGGPIIQQWLGEMKIACPEKVGYASLHLAWRLHKVSGLRQNDYLQGKIAVDALAQQMYLSEKGVPESPRTIIIRGEWVDGRTTRQMSPKGKSKNSTTQRQARKQKAGSS